MRIHEFTQIEDIAHTIPRGITQGEKRIYSELTVGGFRDEAPTPQETADGAVHSGPSTTWLGCL